MPAPSALHRLSPLALCAGAFWCLPAGAASTAPAESLQPFAGIGWAHDDNLLRQADGAPAFGNGRSDSYRTVEAGLVLDKHISRQRIAATAKVSKTAFDHFKQLDYIGHDLQAMWFWHIGTQFDGRLEMLDSRTLAPYTDFNSDQRNLRQQRRQIIDAGWTLHPGWKLRAGAERDKASYDLAIQRFNTRTEKAFDTELLYQSRGGSALGLVARRVKGSYPYRRPAIGTVLTDDFTQDELKLRINWLATGSTTVQGLAGYARREQPSYGEGATSGVNGRINAFYTPRGPLSYQAGMWREFAPVESPFVSYTLNRGASIGVNWAASARVALEASATYERRTYTARGDFTGAAALRDAIRSASVRTVWQVRPGVKVVAAYVRQARTASALGTGKFDANVVQVSANVLF
ncbi:exopolysaccharide biosynthesis operon protein EpsL [Massilia sp. MP_M2]|uniref:XrtB/PEP-CTERM-associated polysaccharide biosynthesis outer membrane protein EpsL n=1 Tax=Massilia sp. MP_M2 TaxID=3071713 RepID=UPI00319EADD4